MQLGHLNVIKRLPDAYVEYGPLINRAMDVLSASFNYLAVHIDRESKRLGVLRKIY